MWFKPVFPNIRHELRCLVGFKQAVEGCKKRDVKIQNERSSSSLLDPDMRAAYSVLVYPLNEGGRS